MMKHTLGPWRIEQPCNGFATLIGGDNLPIFYICANDSTTPRAESDARLIAAAPELLEALQMVMQHGRIDDSESRMNMVAAAIIKATGGAP